MGRKSRWRRRAVPASDCRRSGPASPAPFRRRRVEGILPRPHEMPRVGVLERGFGGLRETELLLRSLAPPHVNADGRHETQLMRVELEDPQESREAREVGVDDALEVDHPAAPPVVELLGREQAHTDENVHRRHDLALIEDARHRAHDARVERIIAKRSDVDGHSPGRPSVHGPPVSPTRRSATIATPSGHRRGWVKYRAMILWPRRGGGRIR
jgi:hypothetical protein